MIWIAVKCSLDEVRVNCPVLVTGDGVTLANNNMLSYWVSGPKSFYMSHFKKNVTAL